MQFSKSKLKQHRVRATVEEVCLRHRIPRSQYRHVLRYALQRKALLSTMEAKPERKKSCQLALRIQHVFMESDDDSVDIRSAVCEAAALLSASPHI